LKNRIENYKNFDKEAKKKKTEIKRKWIKLKLLVLSLKKIKNHKLDLKGKIESNKNFYKRTKK
jgi:hypothetical protein